MKSHKDQILYDSMNMKFLKWANPERFPGAGNACEGV